MNFLTKNILVFVLPLVFIFSFFGGREATAQVNGPGCVINSAAFRTGISPATEGWYADGEENPYVYIDFVTTNCVGQTIEVSITEDDSLGDDDVNGNIGLNDDCDNSNNSCMDNRIITVPTANFTIAMRAGEDECEFGGSPDCHYHIETWDSNGNHEWGNQVIEYDCDGACEDFWTYMGILPVFQGFHQNDPDSGGDGVQSPNGDDGVFSPNGGQPVNIQIPLPNPLAGTVDDIPGLFQKIVEIIIKIAIPIVAMAIVYSGLLFVTARGNDEQITKAKNAFLFAVIGGLILLASWLIADAIKDALMTINN